MPHVRGDVALETGADPFLDFLCAHPSSFRNDNHTKYHPPQERISLISAQIALREALGYTRSFSWKRPGFPIAHSESTDRLLFKFITSGRYASLNLDRKNYEFVGFSKKMGVKRGGNFIT